MNSCASRLRASSALFEQIFDLVPEGLVLTDARNRYQNVNRAWLERTGYTREQVIGRTSRELKLWPNPVDPLLLREALAHDGQVDGTRVHARMADGSTMLAEIFGRRFQSNGETTGLWLSRDITEREHMRFWPKYRPAPFCKRGIRCMCTPCGM